MLSRSMVMTLCFVGLLGCTAPTYYRPATNGFGYAEQQIGPDRYQVAFGGNHKTRRETAHQYVLFRAAQLADQKGFRYVAVNAQDQRIERYGDLISRPTERLDLGLEDGQSPAALGDRDDEERVRSTVERYQAILDVSFYHDEQSVPSGTREVYLTDEVLQELGSKIDLGPTPSDGSAWLAQGDIVDPPSGG
jgi:hypothetical protein